MKILHCVESYYPSKGGMQEVVKQLSERLVALVARVGFSCESTGLFANAQEWESSHDPPSRGIFLVAFSA